MTTDPEEETMSIPETPADLEALYEEVKSEAMGDYDLRARLIGQRSKRTGTVTVFGDDAAGATLGGAEDEVNKAGLRVGRRRWGIIGKIDELQGEANLLLKNKNRDADEDARALALADELDRLTAAAKEAREELFASAYVFNLRAIPDLIQKGLRREARAILKITSKGIPEAELQRYNEVFAALFFSRSTVSWEDKGADRTFNELTWQQAEAFREILPPGEYAKIDAKMEELSLTASISATITDDADF